MLETIDVSDIEIGIEATDWEDAIRKSSHRLLETDRIKQSYVEAMVNGVKELGPYIVLNKAIALAHARPECGVKKDGIIFTTLKHGVPFGNEQFDPIRLIITLAAVDDNAHLDLMMELAGVLMDESNVGLLINSRTPEEFKERLHAAL